METPTNNYKHPKIYWKWVRFRGFVKYKIPEFFIWLFYKLPRNYFLVKKYPFLKPSCGWGTDMEYKRKGYHYHYEETWLDGMPSGWRKAFGIRLCEDLKKALANSAYASDYRVHQVKEKFGTLCWYDEGGNNLTRDVINKYERLSEKTCQNCGAPAEYVTTGWIGYYCGRCVKKFKDTKYRKLTIYDTV